MKEHRVLTSKEIAFTITMAAVSNILGLPIFTIPLGFTSIHFIQIPIILTALALGPIAGGFVGFTGAIVQAVTLQTPNFYILPGNAILGVCTGLIYMKLKRYKGRQLFPQILSVIGAYVIQMPDVYVTDIYLAGIPQPLVIAIIVALFFEDMISVAISNIVLNRVRSILV